MNEVQAAWDLIEKEVADRVNFLRDLVNGGRYHVAEEQMLLALKKKYNQEVCEERAARLQESEKEQARFEKDLAVAELALKIVREVRQL